MRKEIKGLNGLRAIAVILVLIYHFYPNILKGGFLGVDLFFVLSGYLITSILLNEINKNGKIDILNFYYKRIKRLIPLSYFMLILLIIIMGLTNHDWLIDERKNILHSFFYNLNLHNILAKKSYFDDFSIVSPVKHLWSLAIEMKFYILFPFLFYISKNKKTLRKIFIILFLISVILSISVLDINVKYNLLFTRMYAILAGSILASFVDLEQLKDKKVNILGYLLLIVSIISMVFLDQNFIYSTNIIYIFSIIFALIILFLANSKILEKLNYIGNISYGIYIFHFAIISLTTPFIEYASPNILHILLRLVLTVLLSMFSYHFIETPIRVNGFKYYFTKAINYTITPLLSVLAIIMLFGVNLEAFSYRLIEKEDIGENIFKVDVNKIEIPKIEKEITIKKEYYKDVLLIGDSVGINISTAMSKLIPYIEVDAQTGRFLFDAIKIADKYKRYNNDEAAIIIVLGTNGPIKESELVSISQKFNKADVYFININIPRSWNKKNNKVFKESIEKIPNAYLVDWEKASLNRRELLRKDRVHLNEKGVGVYISLIMKKLQKKIDPNETKEAKFHIIYELRNKKAH